MRQLVREGLAWFGDVSIEPSTAALLVRTGLTSLWLTIHLLAEVYTYIINFITITQFSILLAHWDTLGH